MFYILCKERTNGIATWWKPNEFGYTTNLDEAGLYTAEQAARIVRNAMGMDVAVPKALITSNKIVTRRVVDLGDGHNFDEIDRIVHRTKLEMVRAES